MPYTIQEGSSICLRICIGICIGICIVISIIIVARALTLLDWLRQYSYDSPAIALSVLFFLIIGSYG